jgi:hypothetical protein
LCASTNVFATSSVVPLFEGADAVDVAEVVDALVVDAALAAPSLGELTVLSLWPPEQAATVREIRTHFTLRIQR